MCWTGPHILQEPRCVDMDPVIVECVCVTQAGLGNSAVVAKMLNHAELLMGVSVEEEAEAFAGVENVNVMDGS